MPSLFLVEKPAIPDAAARSRALDPAASFIVEAPAGSGKTGLLIQRFLKLLAAENVDDPAQVLAITFTRKATAEMRDRVFKQLLQARQTLEPPNAFDRETRPLALAVVAKSDTLGWNLIDDPRRLNIRTIDSVCADIARGLPILSGSGGGLAPAEDARALHHEAARRTLMLLGGPDLPLTAALETLLLHRDGNLKNCESLLAEMLATRDQWGELIPLTGAQLTDHFLDTEVLPRLDRALDLAICRALTRLTQIVRPSILSQLCELAAEMARSEGYEGNPSPLLLCANKRLPPEEKAAHLDHWHALISLLLTKAGDFRAVKGINKKTLEFVIEKQHKQELIEILEELRPDDALREALCNIRSLPPAQYPRDQWPTAKALFRVLSRALVELQFVFAARGQADFTETALQARSALLRPGALDDLRTSRTLNLQHLLVDEVQDTSSSQYEFLQLLTRSWDGGSQTVFLVGDPKQSIYLFRQARVERFVQTMHTGRLGDLPVEPLHLTANFRSQSPLVQAFNTTFEVLFPSQPDPTRPELVPYRQAHAIRSNTNPGAPGSGSPAIEPDRWGGDLASETWVSTNPHVSEPSPSSQTWHCTTLPYTPDRTLCADLKRTQTRLDAAEIRRLILAERTRNPTATQAVLVRSRVHLIEIVAALKQSPAIPFRALNIEPLGERQEILDLLALTRALLHPADRTAWLALLRTPWVGLTLADLHLLAGADDPALADIPILSLLQSRGDLLTPDAIARLEPFWPILNAALGQRTRQPLARTIERTWSSFNAPLYATPEQLENTARYLQLVDELQAQSETGQGSLDLTLLADRLAVLYATPAPVPGAVDLATIHSSKGLEWDVVFVPALGALGRNTQSRLLSWLETDGSSGNDDDSIARGILAPIQSKGKPAQQLNAWMSGVQANRAAAERTRLFYVACTRAREELHLFATLTQKASGELSPTANTLLHAAWPAAQSHFEPAPALPEPATLALAASAEPDPPRLIQRLPPPDMASLSFPFRSAAEESAVWSHATLYPRPEGSFTARTVGNTLHAFLQQLTTHIASGTPAPALLNDLPTWQPRILAVLRSSGIAPSQAFTLTTGILRGLTNTLTSREGLWLLSSHPQATTESALTHTSEDGTPQTLRLDRTFLAGPTPGTQGTTHLWIIDYKTATHGTGNLRDFLAQEESKYASQLAAYATLLATQGKPIRTALFYPMLPHLHLPQRE